MSPKTPKDELLERYSQATAMQPDGSPNKLPDSPSAAMRERIMQAARAQVGTTNSIANYAYSIGANSTKDLEETLASHPTATEAANDSFWHIKAVASLAVMGLSALLWWQFEAGTPEEQQAAKSTLPIAATASAPAATAAAEPIPVPVAEAALPQINKQVAAAKTREPSRPAETAPASRTEAPAAARSAPSMVTAQPPTDASQHHNTQTEGAYLANSGRASIPMPSAPLAAAKPAAPSAHSILLPTEPLFTSIEQRNAPALRQALGLGISPNARSSDGNPALTQAVMQRWAEGVRILLASNADPAAKNNKGHTASDVAFELGYSDMAELLAMSR